MAKLFAVLLIPLLLLGACSTNTTPTEPAQPTQEPEATVTTDPQPTVHPHREKCSVPAGSKESLLTYKVIGNRKLRLYFLPPLQQVYEKAPIIFMFPGGGLMECDIMQPYSIYQSELAAIRNAGFAVATIEYRVGGEGVHAQQVLTDCMDAVRYVSYYSDVLNVDTQKIVTTGHSSGGHISLLLAYGPHETFDLDQYWSDAEDFHVVGSYALSPGTVFYAGDGPHNGYYSNGASKNASLYPTEEMRHLISPITHVGNGGVPCKILMGEEDELVAAASVAMFKDACDAAGVACEVVWFKNAGHGFESRNGQPVTPNYNTERAKILEFAQACIQ